MNQFIRQFEIPARERTPTCGNLGKGPVRRHVSDFLSDRIGGRPGVKGRTNSQTTADFGNFDKAQPLSSARHTVKQSCDCGVFIKVGGIDTLLADGLQPLFRRVYHGESCVWEPGMKQPEVDGRSVIRDGGIPEIFQTLKRTFAADNQAHHVLAVRISDIDDSPSLRRDGHHRPQVHLLRLQSSFGAFRFQLPLEPDTAASRGFTD
jgi:hypothetical protein